MLALDLCINLIGGSPQRIHDSASLVLAPSTPLTNLDAVLAHTDAPLTLALCPCAQVLMTSLASL